MNTTTSTALVAAPRTRRMSRYRLLVALAHLGLIAAVAVAA